MVKDYEPPSIYILARVSANGKLPNEVVGDWTPNSTAPTLVGAERRTVPKAWMDPRLALPSQRSNHRGTIIFSDPVNPLPLLHRHLYNQLGYKYLVILHLFPYGPRIRFTTCIHFPRRA